MKFATRRTRNDFIQRDNKSVGSKVVLRNIYDFLTEFEYAPESEKEAAIDNRFCDFLLASEDTNLIFDFRANNGHPNDQKFDSFWDELGRYLDEKSAVHERRSTDMQFMSFAISVEISEFANRGVQTYLSDVILFVLLFQRMQEDLKVGRTGRHA